ncbi:MAG: tRNA uridine-5-carboxymethylaminomethyl(34) synthesis GTPase MnmE [Clostridiales bacterium]|nr:tRNA uridine-5-carboxymethylaminomethyl(34) synthesis GTPase MnmE [Clostridiales bacterium]
MDTIAAIATAPGRGAIGILRISGPEAVDVLDRVFTPRGKTPLRVRQPGTLIYGDLRDGSGALIDRCLATFSVAPHSYTGEDTAELQCHGSAAALRAGLEALFQAGARQAGPGEFTQRAFLNGKLDLVQAEAVIDLIDAETDQAAKNAAGQLTGTMSRRINEIYDQLVDLMAHFHAVLDYPDEDIDPFESREISQYAASAAADLAALEATYRRGRQLTEGVATAIVGAPNAGKSSLLNALLGYERAIVTDIPGTTRDTVEEKAQLGGVLLRLIDTAGLRDTADAVERLGVARSRAALERAELALVVLDGSRPLDDQDRAALAAANAAERVLVLVNKSDLPRQIDLSELSGYECLPVSAKTQAGLPELERRVGELFAQNGAPSGQLLTNARQAEAVGRAAQRLRGVQSALDAGMPPDAVLADVEDALDALGQVTGRQVSEDITDRIFSRFCVGK